MAHWWEKYPWRMVQTNLREIDMADIDAEAYADSLAQFGATVVTLNAGGILASYPSRLPYQQVSEYLTGSSLRQLVDACHARGIRVIARMDFSKIPLEVYRQHPDWAFRTETGEIVEQNSYVQTCQNSVYQREKTSEIFTELLTTHPFDGVYCNMSGFVATDYSGRVYGLCHCESCRRAYLAETGQPLPAGSNPADPAFRRYMAFQMKCAGATRAAMVKTIKGINPEIAVDKVDYLRTESHSEIGYPIFPYSASSNSRRTVGPLHDRVSDNASVDFMGFRYRDSSVSPALLALRQWQNLANAGSVSLYIMGRLDNHADRSGFDASRKAFAFHQRHEELFTSLSSAAQVLLVCKNQAAREEPEGYGWIRTLTAGHIPFDEIRCGELDQKVLAGKKLVILADVGRLAPGQAALLDDFVRQGGSLVASGDNGQAAQPLACLGVEVTGEKKDHMSAVLEVARPDVFPRSRAARYIPFGPVLGQLQPREETETLLTLVPEHPYGPPECCYCTQTSEQPGMTVHPWGEGKGICLPWKAGSFYHTEGHQNTLNFLLDVLELAGAQSLAPALTPMVELTLHKTCRGLLVQLVNASGCFANSYLPPLPVYNVELCLPGVQAERVRALAGGNAAYKQTESGLCITLDKLGEYEAIEIL